LNLSPIDQFSGIDHATFAPFSQHTEMSSSRIPQTMISADSSEKELPRKRFSYESEIDRKSMQIHFLGENRHLEDYVGHAVLVPVQRGQQLQLFPVEEEQRRAFGEG
jgi:hypothetical protein